MIISITLTPNEVEETLKIVKEEIAFLEGDPIYAEDYEHPIDEVKEVVKHLESDFVSTSSGKLYKFSSTMCEILNHITYCWCLLNNEDETPQLDTIGNVETKIWKHKTKWASGYIDPANMDSEQTAIYLKGQLFSDDLAKYIQESQEAKLVPVRQCPNCKELKRFTNDKCEDCMK